MKHVNRTITILVFIFLYIPMIVLAVASFNTGTDIASFKGFTLRQYANLFRDGTLLTLLRNSVIIALLATLIGTFTAVGLYYMKRGKKAVNFVSQITVVNAEIVTAVGFFLLSIFLRDVLKLPLQRGVGWLIVAHTVMVTPYVILTVSPRLAQLNPNLYEAGLDLGAGPLRTLFTVIVPQLVGGMISGFALAFTLSLDDFVVTNLNKGTNGVNTISTYVYASLRRNVVKKSKAKKSEKAR